MTCQECAPASREAQGVEGEAAVRPAATRAVDALDPEPWAKDVARWIVEGRFGNFEAESIECIARAIQEANLRGYEARDRERARLIEAEGTIEALRAVVRGYVDLDAACAAAEAKASAAIEASRVLHDLRDEVKRG